MSLRTELVGIIYGLILVMGMHILAILLIFIMGLIISSVNRGYSFLAFWIYAAMIFSLIQLLYVIPVVVILKQQRRWAMMKGVIIAAILTFFLNGACLLLIWETAWY
jgi:hypothetical protein